MHTNYGDSIGGLATRNVNLFDGGGPLTKDEINILTEIADNPEAFQQLGMDESSGGV
jgi:hypothetical protein